MTAGGALITSHLVKGPLRFSPHPFGARLQAGCAPRAASGLTLDQTKLKRHSQHVYLRNYLLMYVRHICAGLSAIYVQEPSDGGSGRGGTPKN